MILKSIYCWTGAANDVHDICINLNDQKFDKRHNCLDDQNTG